MTSPDDDQNDDQIDRDPRNSPMDDDDAMPTEFIDTPENQPGDQSPPSPVIAEGQERDG